MARAQTRGQGRRRAVDERPSLAARRREETGGAETETDLGRRDVRLFVPTRDYGSRVAGMAEKAVVVVIQKDRQPRVALVTGIGHALPVAARARPPSSRDRCADAVALPRGGFAHGSRETLGAERDSPLRDLVERDHSCMRLL